MLEFIELGCCSWDRAGTNAERTKNGSGKRVFFMLGC